MLNYADDNDRIRMIRYWLYIYHVLGGWLAAQPGVALTPTQQNVLTEKVRWSCRIYRHWSKIVENLTSDRMKETEPKLFTLRNLHDSVDEAWCLKEAKQNCTRPKKRPPPPEDPGPDIPQQVCHLLTTGYVHDHVHIAKICINLMIIHSNLLGSQDFIDMLLWIMTYVRNIILLLELQCNLTEYQRFERDTKHELQFNAGWKTLRWSETRFAGVGLRTK
jgi:hypothetical protein